MHDFLANRGGLLPFPGGKPRVFFGTGAGGSSKPATSPLTSRRHAGMVARKSQTLVDSGFLSARAPNPNTTLLLTLTLTLTPNPNPNTHPALTLTRGRAAVAEVPSFWQAMSKLKTTIFSFYKICTKNSPSVSGRRGCPKQSRGFADAVFCERFAPSAVAVSPSFQLEKPPRQSTFFAAFFGYWPSNDGNNGTKHAICGICLLKTSNTHTATSGTVGGSVLAVARQLEARSEAVSVLLLIKLSFFGCPPSVHVSEGR